MAHTTTSGRASNRWLWLLLLPWLAAACVPIYNRIEPTLFGFPLFYWYQFAWVLISSALTALVYFLTKGNEEPGATL